MASFLRSRSLPLTLVGAVALTASGAATAGAARISPQSLRSVTVRRHGKPAVSVRTTRATRAKADDTYPVVSTVSPLTAKVGDKLTIRGDDFVVGNGKDTVVFQHPGSSAVFVKAATATRTAITVTIPTTLVPFLTGEASGAPKPTVFPVRVLGKRLSRSATTEAHSPTISANAVQAKAALTCAQLAVSDPSGDEDKDGLSNAMEKNLGTDPCNADTDGDGVSDGYEYYAAIDLNGLAYPYPASEPWPNPLDPSDANEDFDGDGLTMIQEFHLWQYASGTFPLTAYSDGTQNSGGLVPANTPALQALDLDRDGYLEDDERDADGDGLSNIVELSTSGTQAWWTAAYPAEAPYTLRTFSGLSPTNPDSDGDGLPDGQDDQDNDGYDNYTEMQLGREGTGLRVQPFNPCLPDPYALTCGRFVPIGTSAWAPFDKSEPSTLSAPGAAAVIPFTWPGVATTSSDGWNGNGGPQGPLS
jgi:hypothetical protein